LERIDAFKQDPAVTETLSGVQVAACLTQQYYAKGIIGRGVPFLSYMGL